MTGYNIRISIDNRPDDVRFRMYDNGELVVDNIGEMEFQYLTPTDYTGQHTLTMTYFQTFNPTVESEPKAFYSKDFTMPALDYTVEAFLLS